MLNLDNVTVSYGSLQALTDVCLEFTREYKIHGIIGPNGAGKSTLMDVISGRIRVKRGSVRLDGKEIGRKTTAWRRRHRMSRSFQRTSIFPSLSVIEQLELVASHVGERDLGGIIEAMDLHAVRHQRADNIAYGDQRRVDVALALLGEPRILLLDEPGAGLSAAETMALFDHLAVLVRKRDMVAVVVEHDVDAVFRSCDVITVLDLGKVLITDRPDVVRADARVIAAYLGSNG